MPVLGDQGDRDRRQETRSGRLPRSARNRRGQSRSRSKSRERVGSSRARNGLPRDKEFQSQMEALGREKAQLRKTIQSMAKQMKAHSRRRQVQQQQQQPLRNEPMGEDNSADEAQPAQPQRAPNRCPRGGPSRISRSQSRRRVQGHGSRHSTQRGGIRTTDRHAAATSHCHTIVEKRVHLDRTVVGGDCSRRSKR